MKTAIATALTAGFLLASTPVVLAEDDNGWSGGAELGFNRSTGNSETDNLLARVVVNKKFLKWSNEFKIEAIRSSEDSVRTKESILFEVQTNREFGDAYYAFGNLRHNDDKFGGFRTQTTLSAGLGWNVIKEEGHNLNLEAGVGYRRSEEQGTGIKTTEPTFVGSAKWGYQATETTELSNNFRVETASDNTFLENEIAARVAINSTLGLKVSYLVRNNSDVPVGTEKTDTLTSISLDYKF
ncbi:DUF481 domain-containing protein [Porticoccus sp. W117]|uniref:DUF481 domain-containing protein n=1 Tax=Porticoccus sp. W117 TaxID=3054777 RepID=UPI002595531D|nr:DUF481 domain-containing protein [Porticoccus sp. W117]MDM3870135.1 DUF481 domain-containing protein [Porticoccus sp. W117]